MATFYQTPRQARAIAEAWELIIQEARQLGWSPHLPTHGSWCDYSRITDGISWKIVKAGRRGWYTVWRTESAAVDGVLQFWNARIFSSRGGIWNNWNDELALLADGISPRTLNEFRSSGEVDVDDQALRKEFLIYASSDLSFAHLSPQLRATLRIVAEAGRMKTSGKNDAIDVQHIVFWRGGLLITSNHYTYTPSRLTHIVQIGATLARSLRCEPGSEPHGGLAGYLQSQPW